MKSVRKRNFFENILVSVPDSNKFDLSFDNRLSLFFGRLTPVLCQEVLPGDKFNISEHHVIKSAPLLAPVMHRVNCHIDYFFVPNRILWSNWEAFISPEDPNASPQHPYLTVGAEAGQIAVLSNSLLDYLGIPTNSSLPDNYPVQGEKINAFPVAAYYKIYDDWFRDQNLSEEMFTPLTDGDNTFAYDQKFTDDEYLGLKLRSWEKDYFSSALPFAQKGQDVVLPLGTEADIVFDPTEPTLTTDQFGDASEPGNVRSADITGGQSELRDFTDQGLRVDNSKNLKADLTTATSATINELRVAIRLQEFLEKLARAGSRYTETLKSMFGVISSDARLQRSERIGSLHSNVIFTEVEQTSETAETPLGQYAGRAMSVNNGSNLYYRAEEHGFIIGLVSLLPETSYSQGIHKKFLKTDIFDYYNPHFANLGEQAVKNKELFVGATAEDNDLTFGYQSRFAELKYNSSQCSGSFRNQGDLSFWVLDRFFQEPPQLNQDFVEAKGIPEERIFADTDPTIPKMYMYIRQGLYASRKIPYYSTPELSSI